MGPPWERRKSRFTAMHHPNGSFMIWSSLLPRVRRDAPWADRDWRRSYTEASDAPG